MTLIRITDIETTAMSPADGVVIEIGYTDLHVETGTIYDPVSCLYGADVIPPENRAVHHISLAEVADLPRFDPIDFLDDAVMAGVDFLSAFNTDFERSFIAEPYLPWICAYKAALRVWPDAPSHGNSAIRYWLEDAGLVPTLDDRAMPPHRAGSDSYVSAHTLRALFEAGTTLDQMLVWTREPRLLPRCPLHKFKGRPWADVEFDYLCWIVGSDTMEADIIWNAQRELDRRTGR